MCNYRVLVGYDELNGLMWWLERPLSYFNSERAWKSWNTRHANKPAFNQPNGHGYLKGYIFRTAVSAHRMIWLLHYGHLPSGKVIDHINGDPLDNRIANLRCVTQAENLRNMGVRKLPKSGVVGVYPSRSKWEARLGRRRRLGTFDTIEQAVEALAVARVALGFHPNHGRLLTGAPVREPVA